MERYYLNVINGEKVGLFPSILKGIFYPISRVYAGIMKARNYFYDKQWFLSYQLPKITTISVGNIVMGGTGKTPTVQMLAAALTPGYPLAILTRGYRSSAENAADPVILQGNSANLLNGTKVGDEALLHAHRFPNTPVIVNKNRIKSCRIALKQGMKIAVLDDGMQHRKVHRDFETVVVNSHDPFGKGYVFPRGFLREDPTALKRADLIVINHVDNNEVYQSVCSEIAQYTRAPCIGTILKATGVYDLQGLDVGDLKDKKIGLFCAIGSPKTFRKTLESMGGEVVAQLKESDHTAFSPEILQQYAAFCIQKNIDCLICTEKDRVKMDPNIKLPLPVYWVEVTMEIVEGREFWDNFISDIKAQIVRLD